MTWDKVFIGAVLLSVISSFAAIAFGAGGHGDGARLGAGIIAAVLLLAGVGIAGGRR